MGLDGLHYALRVRVSAHSSRIAAAVSQCHGEQECAAGVAAAPAPHKIAEQINTASIQCQMAVRYYNGEALEKTLAWATNEVEGFMRT